LKKNEARVQGQKGWSKLLTSQGAENKYRGVERNKEKEEKKKNERKWALTH
jgi:hypothetical protein